MKLILTAAILILVFMWAFKKAPGLHGYKYVSQIDTSVIGPVTPDDGGEDTTTLPPPDTLPIPPSGPRHDLIWEELYETTPINSKLLGFGFPSGGGCCSYSHTLSDSFAFAGTKSLRTDLYNTDAIVGASLRSELNSASNGEPVLTFERWWGFAVFFPSWYAADVEPMAFAQLHANDNLSPPVALWTWNDNIGFAFNGGNFQSYGAVPKNVWARFVLHIKWDVDPANNGAQEGIIEIWMNDVLLTSKSGKNSPAGVTYGPYPKWGIYEWPWAHTDRYSSTVAHRVIYFDNSRYGTGLSDYASVAP